MKPTFQMTNLRNRVAQEACLADVQFMELRLEECRKTLRGLYDLVQAMERLVGEEEHKGVLQG